jgi:hypothetical protein
MPFRFKLNFRIQISKYRIRISKSSEFRIRISKSSEFRIRISKFSNKNFEIIKLISKFWAEYYFEMLCFEILKFRNIDFEIIFFNFEISQTLVRKFRNDFSENFFEIS